MTGGSDSTLGIITPDTIIKTVIDAYPHAKAVFEAHGLKCSSCWISNRETIASGARTHRIAVEPLLADVSRFVRDGTVPAAPARGEQPPASRSVERLDKKAIGRIIAIMSGKGGVGKSLVSGLLAVSRRRSGAEVGVLDADITGPSIPRMFGVSDRVIVRRGQEIEPGRSSGGIKLMSMNLLLEREDIGVNWRGPMISQSIKQFFSEVAWGALDDLIVDLPPGTSDAPMTVLQALPLDGVVIVSTPQALTGMVVSKAIKMVQRLHVPIIGLVENMGYIVLPGTGQPYELFGPSRGAALSGESGAPLLGRLPIDPEIARLCDTGQIERYHSTPYDELADNFARALDLEAAAPIRAG